MIKINLLPKKEIKQRAALVEQGAVALFSIAAVLLVLFFLMVNVNGKVKELDNKITTTKQELDKLKKNEAKIEELKASEAIFQKKIDVIKRLKKRKTGPVRMLDEIASRIPGKMWLTNLQSQGALLTLDGVAIDNETIAQFMTNLEKSDQFENVELKFAQEVSIEDFMFKKFSVSYNIKAMKELTEEEKEKPAKEKTKKKKKKK